MPYILVISYDFVSFLCDFYTSHLTYGTVLRKPLHSDRSISAQEPKGHGFSRTPILDRDNPYLDTLLFTYLIDPKKIYGYYASMVTDKKW